MLPKCIFQSNKTNIVGHWEALLETLAAEEKGRLAQGASNQRKTEARILGTPEAAGVVIPQATLIARLDKIRRRYEDAAALDAGLERLGLSRDDLAAAVTRDLYVEAVVRAPALLRRAVVRATADRWEADGLLSPTPENLAAVTSVPSPRATATTEPESGAPRFQR